MPKSNRALALHATPTDFSPMYSCPGCSRVYGSRELAISCSTDNEQPTSAPGDIVYIDIGYGWFDGAEHWLKKARKDGTLQLYGAYFVVTGTKLEDHRLQYSVKTLGIKNGNPTGLRGWTTNSTHIRMTAVKNPDPRLIAESREFIGEIYDHLL